jgi:hypothetical protein
MDMTEKRIKTAQLNLRISPALKAAAEQAAADDQRSVTSLIEKLLTDHLQERGYLARRSAKGARK